MSTENTKASRKNEHQIVVTGRMRPNKTGGETLSFHFQLGPVRVVCVGNIPPEGEDEAPAYVRIQLPDEDGEYPSNGRYRQHRTSGTRDNNGGTLDDDDHQGNA